MNPWSQLALDLASAPWHHPTHLDRHRHERPALGTDVALLAARPHVIIVGEINVKHELTLHWLEGGCGAVQQRNSLWSVYDRSSVREI